jgi:hypothetical protein
VAAKVGVKEVLMNVAVRATNRARPLNSVQPSLCTSSCSDKEQFGWSRISVTFARHRLTILNEQESFMVKRS